MLPVVTGLAAAAKRNAGTPALISGNRSISYAEALDMVARIANHFADRGLKPRSKLFLNISDPDVRLLVTIAAMHCGLIPFALLEMGDAKEDVDYDCVIGTQGLHRPEPLPDLLIDQSVLGGRLSDGTLREFPDQPDDAILFVGSTTGTTGRRKLLAATYGGFRRWAASRAAEEESHPSLMHFFPDDRLLTTVGDVTFAGVGTALQCLTGGATYVRSGHERAQAVRYINLFRVTQLWATGGTLGEIMDAMNAHKIVCPSVTRIVLIGALFDASLVVRIEQHFAAEIRVAYGASEVGRISCGVVTSADFRFGYVGELDSGVQLFAGGTRDNPAPLVLLHNPAAYTPYYSGGRIVPFTDKLYTLPDLGYVEGTRIYLAGRDDEVFNVNGNKTAFSLIDAAVRGEPGIRDVAVVSAAEAGDVAGLLIGVVATGELDVRRLAAAVVKATKTHLAVNHVHIFRIDSVPRNAFGKTDREGVIAAYRRQAATPATT